MTFICLIPPGGNLLGGDRANDSVLATSSRFLLFALMPSNVRSILQLRLHLESLKGLVAPEDLPTSLVALNEIPKRRISLRSTPTKPPYISTSNLNAGRGECCSTQPWMVSPPCRWGMTDEYLRRPEIAARNGYAC